MSHFTTNAAEPDLEDEAEPYVPSPEDRKVGWISKYPLLSSVGGFEEYAAGVGLASDTFTVLSGCPGCSGSWRIVFKDGRIDAFCPSDACGRKWKPGVDASSAVAEDAEGEWPEPVPLDAESDAPFPVESLPAWLGEMVRAAAGAYQVPLDMPGLLGLAMIAIAAQREVVVAAAPEWTEPLSLWVLNVVPTGERKSPVLAEMLVPVQEREKDLQRTMKHPILQAAARKKALEARAAELLKAARKTPEGSPEWADYEAAQVAADEFVVPASPKLIVSDVTPETLASRLFEQSGRLAVVSDEGGVFDTFSGRYNRGVPNLDTPLKGYSGGDIRVDRQGRSEAVERAALTFAMSVQPHVLRAMGEKEAFQESGFLGRFIFCVPRSLVGSRSVDPPAVPVDVRVRYQMTLEGLLKTRYSNEAGEPLVLRLSPEAVALLREFRRDVEERSRPDADLGGLQAWANKHVGTIVRIGGLLHVAEHADVNPVISGDTMRRALSFSPYLVSHARVALGLARYDSDGQTLSDARRTLAWLTSSEFRSTHLDRRFTLRDVQRKLHLNREPAEKALALLGDRYFVRCVESKGRKVVFEVHPTCDNARDNA